MRLINFILFTSIVVFSFKSYAIDTKRFCVVEVPIIGLSGISLEQKWRGVLDITVFEDSPHPILYGQGFHRMKLDGYIIREASKDEIPWNSLFEHSVVYHDDSNQIYAKGNLWGEDMGVRKLNKATGEFVILSADEALLVSDKLTSLHNPPMVLKSGNILEINDDRTEYSLKTPQGKMSLPTLFKAQPHASNNKNKKLYGGVYFPDLKEYLAYGSLKNSLGLFQKPNLYRVEGESWVAVRGGDKLIEPAILVNPNPLLKAHNGIIFIRDNQQPTTKLYYLDKDNVLKTVSGSSSPLLNIEIIFNEIMFRTMDELYRLNASTMTLEKITVPEGLAKDGMRRFIEMPKSKVVLIISGTGLYLMDDQFNITPSSLFDEGTIGKMIGLETALIPVREEVFFSTTNGEHLFIDKKISNSKYCTLESN